MFEAITQSATRKWSKGAVYAMPATLLIYALVGTGLALYSILGPQDLRPPQATALILNSIIPLDFPIGEEAATEEKGTPDPAPAVEQAPAAELDDDTLVEPVEGMEQIPLPPREPVKGSIGGRGVPGGITDTEEGSGGGIGLPGDGTGVRTKPRVYDIGDIRPPKAITRIEPIYPPHMEQMRLKATVHVEVVIDENGRVVSASVAKSSNPLFDQAALDAARKWRFSRPVSQPGGAVRVHHLITFRFR
jgi:protein TonB